MARKKADETEQDQTAADAGETAPGEASDVIEARQEMQSQDGAVENPDEAAAGNGGEDVDLGEEGEAQQAAVTGGTGMTVGGPTQDELNPAYSAPTLDESDGDGDEK